MHRSKTQFRILGMHIRAMLKKIFSQFTKVAFDCPHQRRLAVTYLYIDIGAILHQPFGQIRMAILYGLVDWRPRRRPSIRRRPLLQQ